MINLLKDCIPFPFSYKGSLENGARNGLHGTCRKCTKRDCLNQKIGKVTYYECSGRFSCIAFPFMGESVDLIGLIQYPDNKNFPGGKRKPYKPYIVTQEDIKFVQLTLTAIEKYITNIANERVKDSVSFLHDIATSVTVVLSWCQKVIDKQPGSSFEEKLKDADFETLNLFKSINLLQEQLALANIIAKPEGIKDGRLHRSKIHPFMLKHVKLFEPLANDKGCNFILKGHTTAEMVSYNSFQFIPLILLDNAVKYSLENHDITVQFKEEESDVVISVISFGPIVPPDCRTKIFEKYFRGPNVNNAYPDGMGLGLYIAQQIAIAHETSIFYKCSSETAKVGNNEFGLTVKKVASAG